MPRFGIIAEGVTDQIVIENILLGFFQGPDNDIAITFIQPPRPPSNIAAGWGHVFGCLQRGDCEQALQFNDYVVVQIDTDRQDDAGFDVPRREAGRELSPRERIDRVIARLKACLSAEFLQQHGNRIIYAIAVDSIECWLLPTLNLGKQAAKTTGCLESANRALHRLNKKALSSGDEKFAAAYEQASAPYSKRRTLMQVYKENVSLEHFVEQLINLDNRNQIESELPSDGSALDERN